MSDSGRRGPFEAMYQLGDRLNKYFNRAESIAEASVISIGNITTGGTGKTPATIYFSKLLATEDYNLGILSRGYGGRLVKEGGVLSDGEHFLLDSVDSGDEPYLIAANLPGVCVAVGKNRYSNGLKLRDEYKTSLFILDDGFQHYKLKRNVDVVLIDATNPFGNGHLLPSGILREEPAALERADIAIITKCNLAESQDLDDLEGEIKKLTKLSTVFRATHSAKYLVKLPFDYRLGLEENQTPLSAFHQETIWAISAIGNHRSFENQLLSLGVSQVKSITYRDHHNYSLRDIKSILKRVNKYDFVVTTEKDYIKLRKFSDELSHLKNFYYLKIEFEILNNEVLLKEGLKAKLIKDELKS